MSGCKDCKCEDKKGCSCFGNGVEVPLGPDGASGLSAYEIAVLNGFVGNQAAWLASLVSTVPGPAGPAGPAGTITPLVWTNLVLINGWAASALPNQTPQYCIDPYGYIHFRGVLDEGGASSDSFCNLSAILTANTVSRFGTVSDSNFALTFFNILSTGFVETKRTTGFVHLLSTATPQYILD